MNTPHFTHLVFLEPSDVLFFRDGRPMTGGLAGHGAAWPLPNVINAAFHGALHRADLEQLTGKKVHPHHHPGRDGKRAGEANHRPRKFGSLLTAGPFPVSVATAPALDAAAGTSPDARSRWFFPRPADLLLGDNCSRLQIALRPAAPADQWSPKKHSSLPAPLSLAVGNCLPPSKETGVFQWLEQTAYHNYLSENFKDPLPQHAHLNDDSIFAAEFTVGIGIDPATQTQDGEHIYSAHYLRLRSEWRLGVVAACLDKGTTENASPRDLLAELLPDRRGQVLDTDGQPSPADDAVARIIVGGQQRLCSAVRDPAPQLPLPRGLSRGFHIKGTGHEKRCFVKWILLTPAIWPKIPAKSKLGEPMVPHPGGWLPNWVFINWDASAQETKFHVEQGKVLLAHRSGAISRNYSGPKARRVAEFEEKINAFLVAALVPKAIPVTGWSLQVPAVSDSEAGAKTTHLAVPAGAIYYFETRGPNAEVEARKLAAALNWHGEVRNTPADFTTIKNRRSTLAGEKGFGLGVCGTWTPHNA